MRRPVLFGVMLALPVFSHAQAPGAIPDWRSLGRASDDILVVSVKKQSRVIDPAKVKRNAVPRQTDKNSPSEIPLQNPGEYTLGRVYEAEVLEVLKSRNAVQSGQTIRAYVPGSTYTEGAPLILESEKYVFFLAPLSNKEKDTLTRADAYRPIRNGPAEESPFDPRLAFKIVGDSLVRCDRAKRARPASREDKGITS